MESISKVAASDTYPPVQDEVARLAGSPQVRAAFERFRSQESQFALWQMEATRACPRLLLVRRPRRMAGRPFSRAWTMPTCMMDEVGNVFGVRPGYGNRYVALSAHIDTVFPAEHSAEYRQQGSRLYGPGVSDNGAGIAAMLAVASVLGSCANCARFAVRVHRECWRRRRRRSARHAARFCDSALAGYHRLQRDCRWRRIGHRGGRGAGQPPL